MKPTQKKRKRKLNINISNWDLVSKKCSPDSLNLYEQIRISIYMNVRLQEGKRS